MGSVGFRAMLVPRAPAAAVVLDDKQVAAVGEGAKRFPVVATVNGYTWRTTVTRMRGEFLLGLNRAVREQAGAEAGDTVEVSANPFERDLEGVNLGDFFTRPLATLPNWKAKIDRYLKMPEKGFDKPFFMAHGLKDVDVPYALTAPYIATLKANQQPVTVKIYERTTAAP